MRDREVVDDVVTVRIDLNARSSAEGGATVALLADVVGEVVPGAQVRVEEPEDGLVGNATVVKVDHRAGLVYLDVDWSSLREVIRRGVTVAPVWRYSSSPAFSVEQHNAWSSGTDFVRHATADLVFAG